MLGVYIERIVGAECGMLAHSEKVCEMQTSEALYYDIRTNPKTVLVHEARALCCIFALRFLCKAELVLFLDKERYLKESKRRKVKSLLDTAKDLSEGEYDLVAVGVHREIIDD
jgi:hypothetical protein